MVKKIIYFILAITLLIAIYLTLFEILLYNFHYPFNSPIKDPTTHTHTWIYLLKQHYISLIEVDAFNIHEKRHLLDVKRILETTHLLWIIVSSFTLLITLLLFIKKELKNILKQSIIIGTAINTLLIMLSFNFLNSFNTFHKLFFTKNSWSFPKNSLLIDCFPLLYFQEFFALFLILSFLILIILNFYAKISYENFNNR